MKIRNRADQILGNRMTNYIPSDEEVYYFTQNHIYDDSDICGILDGMGPGILEGCDKIVDLSQYYELLEVLKSEEV